MTYTSSLMHGCFLFLDFLPREALVYGGGASFKESLMYSAYHVF